MYSKNGQGIQRELIFDVTVHIQTALRLSPMNKKARRQIGLALEVLSDIRGMEDVEHDH